MAACTAAPPQSNEPTPTPTPAAATTGAFEDVGQTGLRTTLLTVHTARGPRRYTVEIAASAEEQQNGLMYRRSLAADRGMIFPYDPPQQVAFWMKNTLIPLDLVFIGPDRRISSIAPEAEPLSLEPIGATEPVIAVLEIAGGGAEAAGLAPGDRVDW